MQKVFIGILLLNLVLFNAQINPSQEQIIDSVNITKTNFITKQTSVNQVVKQEVIRQSKGHHLADLLTKSNGLGAIQSGATVAKPIIHGMSGSRISIINNGVKLGSQHWGHDHAPEIDPFFAQEISIIKGAEAIRYGSGAMGGVVVVNAKPMPSELGISGDISLLAQDNSRKFGGGFTLQGRHRFLPKWAWRLQVNAKKSGNYKTADYFVYNTGTREHNIDFQTEYKHNNHILEVGYSRFYSKVGVYTGSRTGDLEDFKRKIALGRPYFSDPFSYEIATPYQQVTHQVAKVVWKQKYDFGALDLFYNFQQNQRKEFESRRGELAHKPSQDWRLTTHQFNLNYEKQYHDWNTKAGVDFYRQINFNEPGNGVTPIIPNFVSENYAAYFLQTFAKNKWKAEAGLRYDYRYLNLAGYDTFERYYSADKKFRNVTYSFGANYRVASWFGITTNIGWAWRPPEANELFMDGYNHGMAIYYLGNKDLKSEKGVKWTTKLAFDFSSTKIEVNGFLQSINHYIYDVFSGEFRTTFSGVYPIFQYRQDNAFFRGLDFNLNQKLTKKLSYQLQSSLVYANNSDTGKPLPMIPPARMLQHFRYEFSPFSKLGETYFQLEHSAVSKQKRFLAEQDLVDETPAAYHLFGLRAGTTFAVSPAKKMHLDFGVNNLFNVLYKEYTDRFRYFAHLPGRQIFLVTTFNF